MHSNFDFAHFHFADNYWFLGLIAIPVIGVLYGLYYQNNANVKDLEKFADKHLIPHIIRSSKTGQISIWRSMMLASLLWFCLIAAMAGPRWNFKEFQSYKDDKTLLILLDLSKSMDANDIKPSRLIRARQEIEDIVNLSKNVKIGLIGFAADAHMVSPITDDKNNILHLLPLIGTDLIAVQGTNILPALKTANQMIMSEPGSNKSILVISDGGWQDDGVNSIASEIASSGVSVNTLGIGTTQGINFVDDKGKPVIRSGSVVMSRLEKEKMQSLSKIGKGQYFDTDYASDNAKQILDLVENRTGDASEEAQNIKHWEERFYIFLFPVMLVLLLWFRKGFTFPIILLVLLTPAHNVQAVDNMDKLLLNKKQFAKKSLEDINDVDTALSTFDDSYRRGVAYYKAGKFKEAEQAFKNSKREEVRESSLYNMGNSLVHQNRLDEATKTYEELLKENPNHKNAKHNLDVVKQMIFVKAEKQKEEKKNQESKGDGEMLGGGGAGGNDEDKEDDSGGEDKDSDESSNEDNKDESRDSDKGKGDSSDSQAGNDDEDKRGNDQQGGDKDQGGDDQKDNDEKDDKQANAADQEQSDDSEKEESKAGVSDSDEKSDKVNNKQDVQVGEGDQQSESEIDQMLDLISNDHKNFLKTQFYIESYRNQTKQANDPW
ncbi:VWA domain-containing protein [Rickettsiaceae bacterium]|nr:VWA domain-containing protein [Rickettsiaceae bacterium]